MNKLKLNKLLINQFKLFLVDFLIQEIEIIKMHKNLNNIIKLKINKLNNKILNNLLKKEIMEM